MTLNKWNQSRLLFFLYHYSKSSSRFLTPHFYSYCYMMLFNHSLPVISGLYIIKAEHIQCDNSFKALLLHSTHSTLHFMFKCQTCLLLYPQSLCQRN